MAKKMAASAPQQQQQQQLLLTVLFFALATTTTTATALHGSSGGSSNAAAAVATATATASAVVLPPQPPRQAAPLHRPPKKIHGDAAEAARRLAKRDAALSRQAVHDAEKLAIKSLKACLDKNPGCISCSPTPQPGLYACDTRALGDDACAYPNFVANPASDGVVNACTCNDGWGSTKLSFKKWAKRREDFVGDGKHVCSEGCVRGLGTDCASAVFNPASCVCIE